MKDIFIPKAVETALNLLYENGFDSYIVGGCVRDSLLNIVPFDYDITTSALPNQVAKVFTDYHIIETGLKHGTQTVMIDGFPLEITTYRVDGSYSDGRHPDSVSFTTSLKEDLSRRDFTINALAYNKADGVMDYFNGIDDLSKKLIRCVGNPDKRFHEDGLRILRGLRFASTLDFAIEENTARAIHSNKHLLKAISKERIFVELKKLLCGKAVKSIIMEYHDVLSVIIPEIEKMVGFAQHNPHHIYDVLTHTALVVENAPPTDILRLSALMHDIAKPDCFTMDKKGIGHFYGHGEKSRQRAHGILRSLKADNATIDAVCILIKWHDTPIKESKIAVKKVLSKIGADTFFDLLDLKRADNMGQNIAVYNHQGEYNSLEDIAREIIENNECYSLSTLAIKGSDLIPLGIKGKAIGDYLSMLLSAVMEEKIPNEKNALLEYVKKKRLS